MGHFISLSIIILAITVITVTGQISTPCTTSMIASFTPCVNYITGSSANGGSPTAGCCKAVESLTSTSMQCMCLIVTGNVPFSLPSAINRALAIQLPKACNSKSVPVQCKSSGVPLPPAGPALFVPPPPAADSPDLPPSPSGSITSVLAPAPSEMSPNGLNTMAPHASQHEPTLGSGIRPVLTPASTSNRLQTSSLVIFLMLAAIAVTSLREVLIF